MKKLGKTTKSNVITFAMVIAFYIVMEVMSNGGSLPNLIKGQLVTICVYATAALSLNLCVGVLGELSLGHAGFMSIGAYLGTVAVESLEGAIPNDALRLIIGMLVGAACAAIGGVLIGVPVLKLNGDYLAIVTLAFGEIIKSIMTNIYVACNPDGLKFSLLTRIKAEDGGKMIINGAIGLVVPKTIATFTMGIVLVLVTLIIVFNLTNSKTGRAIMALRDNKIAAESVGISISKYKLMAFVISAAIAGAAGTLFAQNFSSMEAAKFDFNLSILVLVFVVLGGLGNMRGSIIAAALLTLLPELLRKFSDYRMLAYAIVLIVVMICTNNPTITGYFKRITEKFTKKGGNENA